jgi:hypothetical protein
MRRIILFMVIDLIAIFSPSGYGEEARLADQLPTAPEGKTWKLIWHDEFDGTKLDKSKWEVPPDAPRKGGWWMRKAVPWMATVIWS